jgi:hypothetical protein
VPALLKNLIGQEVTVYFIDGQHVSRGTLQEFDDTFITYRTPYESHFIPISSVRNIVVNSESRPTAYKIGF